MNGLLNRKQWVCWKLEYVEGGKKPTKRPYSAITGFPASTRKPEEWADYHTCLAMAQMQGMSGIGFVFSETDPYFFIDVDDCLLPDNTWSPLAVEFVNKFPGAYVEVSQSGKGLHIICSTDSIPDNFDALNDQTLGLEMYWRWRFVAMTLTGSGEVDTFHTQGVIDSIAQYGNEKVIINLESWTTAPREEWDGHTDDTELLKVAMGSKSVQNVFGDKASFKDLWERNVDKLQISYPSDEGKEFNYSNADMALCSHLAFWTGCDCERIERLFNQSNLIREKWLNREQYRKVTILNAVTKCDSVYRKQPSLTQELINAVTPGLTIASIGEPAYMTVKSGEGGYYGTNHSSNAATFVQNFYPSNTLIFIQRQSYRFNGRVWECVSEDELKHQLAHAMLASEPKAEVINGTYKVLSYLFTRSSMVLGRWGDRDTSHLVVCQNGILDVHSNILEPHNPSYFTTSILPYSYNPSATAPQWETFLNDVLENDNDRIMLLQEWLGYMLITSYEHQKAMLLIGASRSGKGTIGHIMQALVGSEAYAGLTLEGLAVDAILENVLDKTVLFFGDVHSVSGPDRNRILDRFKSITGNDPLPINRKYKGAWNGRFPGRITLAANNIPAFADDSGAMANRLLILPFNRSYLDYEDTKLKDKLLTELPGICNWALIGLARLRLTGKFTDSAAGRSEREEIMLQQAPLMGFVTECCELGLGRESTEAIYNRYKMWKSSEGGTALPRTTFSRAMRSMLRGKIDKCTVRPDNTTKTVQGFSGIQLKPLDPVYAPNNVIPFTGTK